ncbi:MAG: alkaline phosphatase family protein [Candidatus Udaeobacter sp.]
MKKQQNNSTKAWALQAALSVALLSVSAVLLAASFNSTTGQANTAPTSEDNHHDCDHHGNDCNTATPIKHVIVLIGENWTFDSIFATYQPRHGQSVGNLLSRGYVTASGAPGPDFADSQQFQINQPYPATYFIDAMSTAGKTAYQQAPGTPSFPPPNTAYIPPAPGGLDQGQAPFDPALVPDRLLPRIEPSLERNDLGLLRTGASGLPMFTTDTRIPNATTLPNGLFPGTSASRPYDSYVGDMVHRLFHMWQQSDCNVMNATPDNPSGCLNDLYPFVGVARDDGSGSNSMSFLNVQHGDAPVLKRLADRYTLNDNYHQPVMGGTAVQHQMIGTADAIFWETFEGVSQPPADSVANPNPISSTNVAFTADKGWTNCSDLTAPGIAPIVDYLGTLPWHPSTNCDPGHFYMINNMSPGFLPNGTVDDANILSGAKVPPSTLRNIGDALNENEISWAYYGGGYNAAVRVANGSTDPVDVLISQNYCDICNLFSYSGAIMGDTQQRQAHIKDAIDFFDALDNGQLPAVSYVKPDSLVDGHPASSKLDLFEAMIQKIVDHINFDQRKDTVLFITFDEGGGLWDSGAFIPLDFFGDGPRIPMLVVSHWSKGGNVVHSYNDHASVVKFIERNWQLQPLTDRSRDNLPNPIMSTSSPYIPTNIPAIGDLFDMFDFRHDDQGQQAAD